MDSVETELFASLFLLPDTSAVEAVYPTTTHLIVRVACMLKHAACPLYERPSERIHGKYRRTVADVPYGGRKVTLALTVRKFVCDTPECPRKSFTYCGSEYSAASHLPNASDTFAMRVLCPRQLAVAVEETQPFGG